MLLISLDRQVSTHSRPKAAARDKLCTLDITQSFNTQPLEGGCLWTYASCQSAIPFQHTAARRRLPFGKGWVNRMAGFQHTAARRRLRQHQDVLDLRAKFQHTAARRRLHLSLFTAHLSSWVSTHSRPKTAAGGYGNKEQNYFVSTHSRPKTAASIF